MGTRKMPGNRSVGYAQLVSACEVGNRVESGFHGSPTAAGRDLLICVGYVPYRHPVKIGSALHVPRTEMRLNIYVPI
jgi:hypothetical protein